MNRCRPRTRARPRVQTWVSLLGAGALAAALTVVPGNRVAHAIPVNATVPVHGLMETQPLEPTAGESFAGLPGFDGSMFGWGLASVSSLMELWGVLIPEGGSAFQFALGDGLGGGAFALGNDEILALTQTDPLKRFAFSLSKLRFFKVVAFVATIKKLKASNGGGGKVQPIPEPTSVLLFGLGLGVVGYTLRRRRAALA